MTRFLIIVAVCGVVCGPFVEGMAKEASKTSPAKSATTKPAKLPKGFKRLFDGKTLTGWTGRKTLWTVVDGAICGKTTAQAPLKHNDFLYTLKEYGDFELRLTYRLVNHNSGVQVRSKVHKDFRVTGYQADIAERRYTGILYGEGFGGILANVDPKKVSKSIKKGTWNEYRIVCQGKRLQFWINGQPTIDYTDKRPVARAKGVIAFQLHAGPPMTVYFKDIIIKELPAEGAKPPAKPKTHTIKIRT